MPMGLGKKKQDAKKISNATENKTMANCIKHRPVSISGKGNIQWRIGHFTIISWTLGEGSSQKQGWSGENFQWHTFLPQSQTSASEE